MFQSLMPCSHERVPLGTARSISFYLFLPPFSLYLDSSPRRSMSRWKPKWKTKKLRTVDRSARASMKNAANCVNQCELQDTLIIDTSNAHGGLGLLPGPRSVEGRLLRKSAVSSNFDVASGSRLNSNGSFPLNLPAFL